MVNDSFGHQEGDNYIQCVCNAMKESIRECDAICRIGGDEFLIIFTQCTINQARGLWDRINDKLNSYKIENAKPYNMSASYGFSEYDPSSDIPVKKLINIADNELYKQKLANKAKPPQDAT